jgi:hypothetical protein
MTYRLSRTGEAIRDNRAFSAASLATAAANAGYKGISNRQSAAPLLNAHGQVNADSQRELMRAIGLLATAASTGMVETAPEESLAVNHQEAIAAAMADPTGQGWIALGEIIGNQVVETMGRQPVVYPSFFQIIANILIEDSEINMDYGDLLDDRYNDGLEQMMVAEDKALKNIMDAAASIYNPLFLFPTLTPSIWQAMKIAVEEYGNTPVTNALISYDLWTDITTPSSKSTKSPSTARWARSPASRSSPTVSVCPS